MTFLVLRSLFLRGMVKISFFFLGSQFESKSKIVRDRSAHFPTLGSHFNIPVP